MTSTTDFIAELILAANEVEKLQPAERRRLLERSASCLCALRGLLTYAEKVAPIERGVANDLWKLAGSPSDFPDVLVAHALLEAADEIRRLRILIHENEEYSKTPRNRQ